MKGPVFYHPHTLYAMTSSVPAPSLAHARLCIVLAAVLWSTSGAFTKLLTKPTSFGLHEPTIAELQVGGLNVPVQIACYRVLFAGLVLVPLLRPRDFSFRKMMLVMGACFALMNATFITALALDKAANAIILQYTAPLWMYVGSLWLLHERADRRSTLALLLGMVGIGVIIQGGWKEGRLAIILIALASGVAYAGVMLCLRVLRDVSSRWLTVWNHLLSGLVLLPLVVMLRPPTPAQFVVLFLYGTTQMALAYWLVARGLRVVSPQEAGAITLLEPILNPIWAYLVSPETEAPGLETYIGGGIILGALVWRYWPRKNR
jgi:drug/metabolite transporter (DMT)-like permease